MKGNIIVGYPCIGKTSIAGQDNIIDLDSSTFKNEQGIRHEDCVYTNICIGKEQRNKEYESYKS